MFHRSVQEINIIEALHDTDTIFKNVYFQNITELNETRILPFPALLDDLDKELNNYIMRCREWYGWHFPELGKIITDNLAYCKCVQKIGK